MTMNSNNKFGLEYAGTRRVRRGWWMTVLTALTLLTLAALAGWLWSWVRHAAVFGDVMPPMRRAGFPDWVAFVAVGVVVVFLVARLVWDAWMERREMRSAVSEQPEIGGHAIPPSEVPVWMHLLMAFFARRGVMLSRGQCFEIRGICVPNHRLALVWLDGWIREHLRLRLFMTALLEVQSLCSVADEGDGCCEDHAKRVSPSDGPTVSLSLTREARG
jgi:hypothetical protein